MSFGRWKHILLTLALTAGLLSFTSGQKTGLDLLGSRNKIEIPFSEVNGLLMIQLKMNGVPLTFIYDTGAENNIMFKREIALVIGLESSRRIKIVGADLSNTIYGNIVHNVHFELKRGVERVESIIVLEENVYKIQESTGYQIDGLLGGNFFRNTIVKIDYRRNKLEISHPINHKYNLSSYLPLDCIFSEQKPYIKARVSTFDDQQLDVLLLMDTGSSIPFILHTNVDSSLHAPDNVIMGNLGVGLSGTLIGMIGITKKLKFAGIEFRDILTNFQELDDMILIQKDVIRHGILGNDILKRFTVIIDYFHRKTYVKPGPKYNKAFKYDKSGLVIIASGADFNEYHIQAVIPHSPADRAGLKKGDQILTLQRVSVSFRSLHNIQNVFKRKAGKKIRLRVKRDGKPMIFYFELEDMLQQPSSGTIELKNHWVIN
jgi:predicted aspartyl protease